MTYSRQCSHELHKSTFHSLVYTRVTSLYGLPASLGVLAGVYCSIKKFST
jgi:hypothetical protein